LANDVVVGTDEDIPVTAAFDASDIENDTLTYFVVAGPNKGWVVNNNDGTFMFHPYGDFESLASGQSEVTTFTYRVADSHGAQSAAKTVTITVEGVNDKRVTVLVKAVSADLKLDITVYRPQTPIFRRTAVSATTEDDIGAGIRSNGDDDNGNGIPDWNDGTVLGENDLIELSFNFGARQAPQGVNYYLKRSNANVKVWDTATKGGVVLAANDEQQVPFAPGMSLWVKWVNPTFSAADTILTFEARDAQTNAVLGIPDSVRVFRFTSVVIVIGGRGQVPADPPDPTQGVFVLARDLALLQSVWVNSAP